MSDPKPLGEVLFEFVVQGKYVKVTAIDPNTGIEASIVGDPRVGKRTLEHNAVRKLQYVLRKGQDKDAGGAVKA